NLKAGELTFQASTTGSVDIAGNAVVDLGTLTGATGIKINVGKDGVENGSATLLADKLVLDQATLKIDPAYDQPYASAIAMDLSGTAGDTLDGHVEVSHNALFAVGFDTKAEVDAVLGTLVKNGSFADPAPSEPAPGPGTRSSVTAPDANAVVTPNAVVLNKGIKFNGKGGIYVGTKAGKNAADNTLEVDAGSALVVTDKAFDVNPTTGKKTGAAITGNGGNATATIAQGSKLVLVGAFNGADNELEILSGFTSGDAALQNFTVSVGGSDLLLGSVVNGKIDINLTQDKAKLASAFAGASTPVKQLMLDMLAGDKFAYSTAEGYQLINQLAMANNGVAADAAAHAATYAGAQQAAVASVTTMADAMFGRVGAVGVEAASIAATGSQANGGVWLTPMYKSVDADGFNAQGASYGSEVDLAGVAFGTDTVNGNMRFGAVFNIGSGDADGKGNGNGLKDEFDYYGFGIYSAMGFGNFALVGDASLTVISHDVKGFDLHGKADTKAVTMGLTGQYTFATPAVDVTPHLGARFVRLDTESYDLNSAKGTIASTDFDVQNVFSVPVGVTLSKAFVAGGWSLAPNADLTVTFNSGDTEAKSTTTFTGARAIDLNSEVLDEVTYGVTLGLGAQYGAFGTSFGINYTGSENTDAFGVNAQCRYMF
ncbi:autotransporter outer membrane beta-barrel domain-containing protein, partial [Anaerobiospirillum succiniciproducens]|uniref:autotransporter outer membrane beta-barrel domain-containing protein n=1 Tax=Anaerobiospirillum succiniciproducens TaxID=13335 RepID=UPI00248E5C13